MPKKPIHVQISEELYSQFRIKLFKEGKTQREKIQEWIEEYITSPQAASVSYRYTDGNDQQTPDR
jgi:hypothetical protein